MPFRELESLRDPAIIIFFLMYSHALKFPGHAFLYRAFSFKWTRIFLTVRKNENMCIVGNPGRMELLLLTYYTR